MKDQSCVPRAPSSTVDRSTGEDNLKKIVYANSDSDLGAIIIISYK